MNIQYQLAVTGLDKENFTVDSDSFRFELDFADDLFPKVFETVGKPEIERDEKGVNISWMNIPCISEYNILLCPGKLFCLPTESFETDKSTVLDEQNQWSRVTWTQPDLGHDQCDDYVIRIYPVKDEFEPLQYSTITWYTTDVSSIVEIDQIKLNVDFQDDRYQFSWNDLSCVEYYQVNI